MKSIVIAMLAGMTVCASGQALRGQAFGDPRPLYAQPDAAWMRQSEVTGDFVIHAPGLGDFDVFEIAYGLEVGYRMWFTDIFGAGVGIGVEQWTADSGYSRNWYGTLSGDMQVIPLSLTGYLRVWDLDWGVVKALLGLEYAMADSDVRLTRDGRRETVKVDDMVNLRIGAELGVPLTDILSLGVHVGLQETLSKGSAKGAAGGRLKDATLQSAYIGIGLSLAF